MHSKRIFQSIFVILASVVCPAAIFSAPLDANFGTNGSTTTSFGTYSAAALDTVIQPDGKIVVVGAASVNAGTPSPFSAIARYNPDGMPDSTFGTEGKVAHTTGFTSNYTSVVIQPDGKILAGGYVAVTGPGYAFLVRRYNANGTLDASFGNAGVVITSFGTGTNSFASSVLLRPDGKILLVGITDSNGYAFARYNANGSLDSTFDGDGLLITAPLASLTVRTAMMQPDGKIIVVGDALNGVRQIDVRRFNADGTLDATFGSGGVFNLAIGTSSSTIGSGIAFEPSGKIVISVTLFNTNQNNAGLIRLQPNGTLDSAFGTAGIVVNSLDTLSKDVAVQPNGKIVLATKTRLLRYNADGTADNTFGAGFLPGMFPEGNNIALQTDGKIIFVGFSFPFLLVTRFLSDAPPKANFDFDGDGRADVSVFRPSNGTWFLNRSANGSLGVRFGFGTDKIVPADYDGDGRADVAVFRSSNGIWYLQRSDAGFAGIQFGAAEDVPVPADYDGDGKTDLAVWRPSSGVWYINRSSLGFIGFQFGANGDQPAIGDYDGDGKSDFAVFRPSNGTWYIERSRDHFFSYQFGLGTDKPVPADYDGDGKTDIAVYRSSNGVWYVERSRDHFAFYQFGAASDIPTPADYDGDGKTDLAVFRSSSGVWYLNRSQSGLFGVQFGASDDKPIPGAFVP